MDGCHGGTIESREQLAPFAHRNNRACGKPHRLQHRVFYVVSEGLLLRALERVAHHRDTGIRVFGARARRVHERRAAQARDRGRERGAAGIEVVADGRLAHEARAVRHELPERNARRVAPLGQHVAHVPRHRRVEIQHASLHELHHGDVREELRDGADAVHRFTRRRHRRIDALAAIAARPHGALVVHQRDGQAGQPLVGDLARHERVEPRDDARVVGGHARRGLRARA